MELLSYPKTEYLLFASLESLHAESLEWRSEVQFWQEELAFLYKILRKQWSSSPFPSAEIAALEKRLIDITSNDLLKAKEEVESHEKFLSSLIKNNSMVNEDTYRKKHSEILTNMHSLKEIIKSYKRHLFEFIREHEN